MLIYLGILLIHNFEMKVRLDLCVLALEEGFDAPITTAPPFSCECASASKCDLNDSMTLPRLRRLDPWHGGALQRGNIISICYY